MVIVKRPGYSKLALATIGAYWLSKTINPGFILVAILMLVFAVLFFIEDYVH